VARAAFRKAIAFREGGRPLDGRVEGLVEQPERGRYSLTGRGETTVLLAAVLGPGPEEWAAETAGPTA